MDFLKSLSEWYLGVPPADPGQGTAWTYSYRTPWAGWLPPWAVLLLALLAIGFVVRIYQRDARTTTRGARITLIGLRLGVLAMVLVMLTELTLQIDRTGLPTVVVLVDDSGSMSLEDQYSGQSLEAAARELLQQGNFNRATRINLARSILLRDDARFLRTLLDEHKLRVYRFSESAAPLGQTEYLRAENLDELVTALNDLQADGEQTRHGPAVRKVLDDLRGAPPSAIIILSDGITSTSNADRLSGVVEEAAARLVPIFTVGIGSEEPARDLQMYDLLAEEVAFVDDQITFAAKLKAFGFDGKPITVTLKQKGDDRILTSVQATAGADGRPVKIELPYTPTEEGEFDYIVEVTPSPRETDTDNNAETRHVSVRREKIRVLLADGLPRYEYRYLKHVLERDKTVDVDVVLQQADLEYASEDETAIEHFPVKREELLQYDVIVLGDLNPDYLSSGVYANLQDFVRDAGGGIIFVAGPRYNPVAYRGTPLDVMLPVQLSQVTIPPPDVPIIEGFRPELTLEGRKGTSMFRFGQSERESLAIWNQLPELYWLCEATELKDGALVFAEHPNRFGGGQRIPVIAMHRYGAGKVLFHATDDLWRWRFRVGDAWYGRYWLQAIRYLSRSRLLGRDRAAELTADRLVYQQGETVYLRVRFLDERLAPLQKDGVTVMVERRGDVQRPVQLARIPQAPTIFEGQFSRAAEGAYHAWVARPGFNEAPPSTDFRVEAPAQEMQRRSLDRPELQETSRRTRGRYYSLAEAAQLPDDVPPGQPVSLESQDPILLWNRWESMVLFTALLLAEWLLRKRCRLV